MIVFLWIIISCISRKKNNDDKAFRQKNCGNRLFSVNVVNFVFHNHERRF